MEKKIEEIRGLIDSYKIVKYKILFWPHIVTRGQVRAFEGQPNMALSIEQVYFYLLYPIICIWNFLEWLNFKIDHLSIY